MEAILTIMCLSVERILMLLTFDRYKNECQISDLYQFIRKVMEKYNWENSVFYRLLDEYDRICPLDDNELELLMTLLSYPEKILEDN